jgi:hypothetical protein
MERIQLTFNWLNTLKTSLDGRLFLDGKFPIKVYNWSFNSQNKNIKLSIVFKWGFQKA